MFSSILGTTTETMTSIQILMCSGVSVALGLVVAIIHMYKNTYTKNFIITLAVLPLLVQSVIMLVNGNLGTGVAVVGAFSLIRFRSVAGGAREITSVFWSMGIGLATGMGYITYVSLFSGIAALLFLALHSLQFGQKGVSTERLLRITIPEDLDYPNLFDDIFASYTKYAELRRVKTTGMGSLYDLQYLITLKSNNVEKAMIDALRVRNGNLAISSGRNVRDKDEL